MPVSDVEHDDPALALAIGAMLDRDRSQEHGQATVRMEWDGERQDSRCWWRNRSTWRIEHDHRVLACYGGKLVTKDASGRHERPEDPGKVPYQMQLCFPLRASIWGRTNDDYYMASAAFAGAETVNVVLKHREDLRRGAVEVDCATGAMMLLTTPSTVLQLDHFALGPQPDAVFVV